MNTRFEKGILNTQSRMAEERLDLDLKRETPSPGYILE